MGNENNKGMKEVIENRRSIRKYKKEAVSKEQIEDILNCGRLAPSAKNRQPWYFVVIQEEKKDKVAELMNQSITEEILRYSKEILKKNNSTCGTSRVIQEASTLILIFREKEDNWIIGDNLSIGACVENMCLRATELGLGSLWIRDTVYASKEIANYLGKSDMELNCALAIGVPDEFPIQRPRKKLEDMVEWLS